MGVWWAARVSSPPHATPSARGLRRRWFSFFSSSPPPRGGGRDRGVVRRVPSAFRALAWLAPHGFRSPRLPVGPARRARWTREGGMKRKKTGAFPPPHTPPVFLFVDTNDRRRSVAPYDTDDDGYHRFSRWGDEDTKRNLCVDGRPPHGSGETSGEAPPDAHDGNVCVFALVVPCW